MVMKHIISLGAGVQSSTMALMAAHGEITPMPDAAVFADTQWEPAAVYEWLDWLEGQLPFQVHRVTHHGTRLRDQTIKSMFRDMPLPVFSKQSNGKIGITKRQCTRDWKIRPIERQVKIIIGHQRGARLPKTPVVTQWIGISLDEQRRVSEPREAWQKFRYPLVFEHAMTRDDCKAWMASHGYPEPPRSACVACPFHDDYEWYQLWASDSAAWADAVATDETIRRSGGERGELYLHSRCIPVRELPERLSWDTRPPLPPVSVAQGNLFGLECEGVCGV
jgi:hypothetical protein